jgi:hypothetical protein
MLAKLSPNMIRPLLGVVVLLIAFSWAPEAKADLMAGAPGLTYSDGSGGPGTDPPFSISFTIGPESGTIILNTNDLGGGEFNATSGTLTVTGGSFLGSYSLIGGGPAPVNTTFTQGPFDYDNDLFTSQNPSLDGYGLLFQTPTGEINIFGITAGYEFYVFTGSDTTNCSGGCNYTAGYSSSPGRFNITPEPTSVILMSTMLLAVAFVMRKRIARA